MNTTLILGFTMVIFSLNSAFAQSDRLKDYELSTLNEAKSFMLLAAKKEKEHKAYYAAQDKAHRELMAKADLAVKKADELEKRFEEKEFKRTNYVSPLGEEKIIKNPDGSTTIEAPTVLRGSKKYAIVLFREADGWSDYFLTEEICKKYGFQEVVEVEKDVLDDWIEGMLLDRSSNEYKTFNGDPILRLTCR